MKTLYLLGDYATRAECDALGVKTSPLSPEFEGLGARGRRLRAVATSEKRPPRKGEWYLSGAIATAYRAPDDLSTPYMIARLVAVETETVTRIVAE